MSDLIRRLSTHYYRTGTTDTDDLVQEAIMRISALENVLEQIEHAASPSHGVINQAWLYRIVRETLGS